MPRVVSDQLSQQEGLTTLLLELTVRHAVKIDTSVSATLQLYQVNLAVAGKSRDSDKQASTVAPAEC